MAPQNAQQFTTAWAIRQERAFGRETKTVTNGQKKLQMGVSAKKDLRIWEGGVACSGRVRVVGQPGATTLQKRVRASLPIVCAA